MSTAIRSVSTALSREIEQWINLGSPKITDYHIELIDPAASDDVAPHSYIDKRPNATPKVFLAGCPNITGSKLIEKLTIKRRQQYNVNNFYKYTTTPRNGNRGGTCRRCDRHRERHAHPFPLKQIKNAAFSTRTTRGRGKQRRRISNHKR